MLCFSRDTYLLRTSNRFSGWPWSSSTAWPSGKRTTWRSRHAFSRQKKATKQHLNKQLSCLEGSNKKTTHLKYLYMHHHDTPYPPPVKCHALCLWCQECVLCVCNAEAASIAFFVCDVVRMFDWQPHTRGRGAAFAWPCWCSSPPRLLPIPTLSYTLAKGFSNSTTGLSYRFLLSFGLFYVHLLLLR